MFSVSKELNISQTNAIMTHVFLDFLCLQANAETVPKLHVVVTACFSYNQPGLKSSKLSSLAMEALKLTPPPPIIQISTRE
jgi:hypothetical protein